MLTCLRHVVSATLSVRPKCRRGRVCLKTSPTYEICANPHARDQTINRATEQTSIRDAETTILIKSEILLSFWRFLLYEHKMVLTYRDSTVQGHLLRRHISVLTVNVCAMQERSREKLYTTPPPHISGQKAFSRGGGWGSIF